MTGIHTPDLAQTRGAQRDGLRQGFLETCLTIKHGEETRNTFPIATIYVLCAYKTETESSQNNTCL